MDMDPIFAEAMLDEVQELLEEMLELASRAVEADCTDEERHALQGRLITLRERIDETVDAYERMGDYREALYAAWKASNEIMEQFNL
jgi:tetratricopeptide (TPR) repeat protein